QGVAEAFEMDTAPKRIEVYDNSHISGTNAVGAMIVSGADGLSKKHYRTFNIKSTTLTPGDDFAMMDEVLTRRFSRLMKESPGLESVENQPPEEDAPDNNAVDADNSDLPDWPDLILIDGGKGQLSAVREVFEKLDMKTPVKLVAIAKGVDRDAGRETFHITGQKPFMLPARDPVLYFVQRLRDEAHRFAIGTHRARRKKQFVKNPLDMIEGIGPAKKRALLNRFGSAKAISRAAVSDIADVEGISKHLASNIYDHFNPTN
ncbi:Excinuclease ABC subunit C, partial [hydrothermal vent metagenome]